MTEHVDLAVVAARAADEKGGTDILVLEVGEILEICETFVVITARNTRLVRAIAEEIQEHLWLGHDRRPISVEGIDTNRWVLVDYGDLIVHVFLDTEREFYRIERLYRDAPEVAWAPPVSDRA